MASRQTPPELARIASASDSSPTLRTTRASLHAPRTVPSPPALADPIVPALPPSPSLDAGHTGPATEPPSTGAADTREHHRANYPSSTQDTSSAPPTVSKTRKWHRGGRCNNPSSQSAAVSDTGNLFEEGNEPTQRNIDTDRSANPVREADDNPTSRNQSIADTGFEHGENPADAADAATGEHHTQGNIFLQLWTWISCWGPKANNARNNPQGDRNTDEARDFPSVNVTRGRGGYGRRRGRDGADSGGGSRAGGRRANNVRNNSQGDRNTDEGMNFPQPSVTGGRGGYGRRRGGNGGNAAGPVVFYADTVNYYNHRP